MPNMVGVFTNFCVDNSTFFICPFFKSFMAYLPSKVPMMELVIHKDHERLQKERAEQQKVETDILSKYTPSQLLDIFHTDLYFLLNVQEYRRLPIPKNILFVRYRERIVRYHPNNYDDRIFMALNKAYEVMKSTFWKKKYDEYFIVECTVEDRRYDTDFYSFFGAYFENMKVVAKGEAPMLGDSDSSPDHIKKFYAFWKNFESNRNFDFIAYHPNYESMSDHERTEHDNKFKREKMRLFNQHVMGVRNAAAICQQNDPRIAREKISVNPGLLTNGWTESDVLRLKRLIKKFKIGKNIEWKKVVKEFKMDDGTKKSMKDLLVKNTQMEKLQE